MELLCKRCIKPRQIILHRLFKVGYENAKEFNYEPPYSTSRHKYGLAVVGVGPICSSGRLREQQERTRANKRSGRRSKNIVQPCYSAILLRWKKSGLMITSL